MTVPAGGSRRDVAAAQAERRCVELINARARCHTGALQHAHGIDVNRPALGEDEVAEDGGGVAAAEEDLPAPAAA